ncbi:MAG: TetR/AcrR family transcriptional regulator [Ilumatobacteraceae bacterium]
MLADRSPDVTHTVAALLDSADLARNDTRRQGDELRPLGNKARRTRASLLHGAYDCFVRSGYRETSVEAIHTTAGVSIGTFYQYFRDKADVMTTLVAEAIIESAGTIFPTPGDAPSVARSREVLTAFVRHYAATAPFQAVWEEATHFDETVAAFRRGLRGVIEQTIAEQIVEGQRSGDVRADVDPATAARALTAMVDRHCYLTFVDSAACDETSISLTTDTLVTLWERALGPTPR